MDYKSETNFLQKNGTECKYACFLIMVRNKYTE